MPLAQANGIAQIIVSQTFMAYFTREVLKVFGHTLHFPYVERIRNVWVNRICKKFCLKKKNLEDKISTCCGFKR